MTVAEKAQIEWLKELGVRRFKCEDFEVEFSDIRETPTAQPAPPTHELKDQMPSDEEMLGYSSPIKFIDKEN